MKGALLPGGGTSHTEYTGNAFACLSASRTPPQGYVSRYVSRYSRAEAYPSTSRGMLIPSAREPEPAEGRSGVWLRFNDNGTYRTRRGTGNERIANE